MTTKKLIPALTNAFLATAGANPYYVTNNLRMLGAFMTSRENLATSGQCFLLMAILFHAAGIHGDAKHMAKIDKFEKPHIEARRKRRNGDDADGHDNDDDPCAGLLKRLLHLRH